MTKWLKLVLFTVLPIASVGGLAVGYRGYCLGFNARKQVGSERELAPGLILLLHRGGDNVSIALKNRTSRAYRFQPPRTANTIRAIIPALKYDRIPDFPIDEEIIAAGETKNFNLSLKEIASEYGRFPAAIRDIEISYDPRIHGMTTGPCTLKDRVMLW